MRLFINVIALVVFIAGGYLAYSRLTAETPFAGFSGPTADKAPIVTVERVQKAPFPLDIRVTGTVESLQSGDIHSEISGRILEIAPVFEEGQVVEAGTELAKLDDSEYQSALIQAQSQLNTAKLTLTQEKAQAEVAQAELRRTGRSAQTNPLAARVPQIESAQAAVDAAESNLEVVKNRVTKTIIRAPFTGQISNKQVVIGQQIGAGSALGSLFSDASKRIKIHVPTEELLILRQFATAGQSNRDANNQTANRIDATVFVDQGLETLQLKGELDQMTSMVDNQTQLLSLYVNLDESEFMHDLSVGALVDVSLQPANPPEVISVPITAVGQNNSVRILPSPDARELQSINVNPLWWGAERVIIGSGLAPDQIVVTTPLPSNVLDGTRVRLPEDAEAESSSARSEANRSMSDARSTATTTSTTSTSSAASATVTATTDMPK